MASRWKGSIKSSREDSLSIQGRELVQEEIWSIFGAQRFSIAFNTLHKLPNALSKGAICSVRSTPLAL